MFQKTNWNPRFGLYLLLTVLFLQYASHANQTLTTSPSASKIEGYDVWLAPGDWSVTVHALLTISPSGQTTFKVDKTKPLVVLDKISTPTDPTDPDPPPNRS